jgi:hypothetical protein
LSAQNRLCPITVGRVVTVVLLIALFLILLRYWRSGLLLGSLAS